MYHPKEEEGLDRFDEALSRNMYEMSTQVVQSEALDSLTRQIDETNRKLQMKYKREHKYDLKMYEEQLYKEVVYDTRLDATEKEEFRFMNPLKKVRQWADPTFGRNYIEDAKNAEELARSPIHLRKHTKIRPLYSAHSDKSSNNKQVEVTDPYDHWRTGQILESDVVEFESKERQFWEQMTFRGDLLTRQM